MSSEDRDWLRARLVWLHCGLLSPEHHERAVQLIASDPECAACAERFGNDAGDLEDAGHIPPEILARWPQACRDLVGLERRLVARHIEHCRECREELALLGYQPTLTEAGPQRPGWVRPARRPRFGGTLGVLAAAAVFLMILWPSPDRSWLTLISAGDLGQPLLQLEERPRDISGRQHLVVPEGMTRAALDLSLLDLGGGRDPESVTLRIIMFDPEGRRVELPRLTEADLPEVWVQIDGGQGSVLEGVYRLEIRVDRGDGDPRTRILEFTVGRLP